MNKEIIQYLTLAGFVALVLFLTFIAGYLFRKAFDRFINNSTHDVSVNARQYYFIKQLISVLIYLVGIGIAIYLVPALRSLSLSMFAGSGIFAIVIGFASQQALANIVSGVFIIIFRPFSVGDRVRLVGKEINGMVEDITLRHTVIKTYQNKRVIVPNSIISTELVENSNFYDNEICRFIEIGISYDSDIDKAMEIMRDEAMKHPEQFDARTAEEIEKGLPEVIVRVIGFGDSSVNLRANVWAKDLPRGFQMQCDLNKSIKQRFDREGIEIPYPYRTIVYKDSQKNAFQTKDTN